MGEIWEELYSKRFPDAPRGLWREEPKQEEIKRVQISLGETIGWFLKLSMCADSFQFPVLSLHQTWNVSCQEQKIQLPRSRERNHIGIVVHSHFIHVFIHSVVPLVSCPHKTQSSKGTILAICFLLPLQIISLTFRGGNWGEGEGGLIVFPESFHFLWFFPLNTLLPL